MQVVYVTPILLSLLAVPAFADPLDLAEAQNIALAKQPLIQSQDAMVEAARQRAVAEAQLPDPQLKLGLENVPTDTYSLTQDFMTSKTIGIAQTFPGGHKRKLRGEVAALETERSAADLESMQRAVRRDTALAWLNLYYALRARELVQEQQHEVSRQIEAAQINYRTGKGSQEEIFRIRGMLNQLTDRELELAGNVRRARAALARWIGADAERELPDDAPVLPAPVALESLSAHLADRSDLRSFDDAIAAADAETRLARESRKPDWSLELSYSKRGPAFSDMVSAQVGVELPLFRANRQDRRIAERSAQRDRAYFQREDKLRSLKAELAAIYVDETIGERRLKIIEEQTIPNAKNRIASALIAYRDGKTTIAGVYEAHHAELEARLQQLEQQAAVARARIQLAYFE